MEAKAFLGKLPHRGMEAWRWSDVTRAADIEAWGTQRPAPVRIVVPDGVQIRQSPCEIVANDTGLSELSAQYSQTVWDIEVPDGFHSDAPIEIEGLSFGHAQISLSLGRGARINLIEHYAGESQSKGGFVNSHFKIKLAPQARLERVIVQTDPEDCVRLATTHIAAWKEAEFHQHVLAFGGKLTRIETRFAGMGAGAIATLNGAYLLSEARHCDMTSYVDLAAPDAQISQMVKGMVTDQARGVFQGKFHVRRAAQQTDAQMRHDAIMLSERSEIRSKPELEIYADDVACAHGNTLGALDEQALFYMRQRGLPLGQARAMLSEAFLAESFDDVTDAALRESLLDKLRAWLGAHL